MYKLSKSVMSQSLLSNLIGGYATIHLKFEVDENEAPAEFEYRLPVSVAKKAVFRGGAIDIMKDKDYDARGIRRVGR